MKSQNFRHTCSIIAGAAVLATTVAVWAASDGRGNGMAAGSDALAIGQAKVSLTQAIAVAEQRTGGKASKAEHEKTQGDWVYDVEIVNGTDVFDVRVDANAGTMISSIADQIDHDDEHDDEREDNKEE